jgi:hypothetical protein
MACLDAMTYRAGLTPKVRHARRSGDSAVRTARGCLSAFFAGPLDLLAD